MRKTIKLLTLAVLAMFVTVSAFAQVTTSSMSGKVSEKNGTAVVGATIIATHTPSGTKYYATAGIGNDFGFHSRSPVLQDHPPLLQFWTE